MRRRALLCVLWCVAPIAFAGGHTVPAAYTDAANAHDMPPVMLYALSLTESATTLSFGRRPWPWTLNIAGTGRRYATRRAACRALTTALEHTQVVDVGLGQLNVHWQKALFGSGGRFADPCAALNPYANLDAAAALLRRCYEQTGGSWITAAGCYHRPAGGAPAARYRVAFRHELSRLREGTLTVAQGDTPKPSSTRNAVSAHDAPAAASTRVTWINPTDNAEASHALD